MSKEEFCNLLKVVNVGLGKLEDDYLTWGKLKEDNRSAEQVLTQTIKTLQSISDRLGYEYIIEDRRKVKI